MFKSLLSKSKDVDILGNLPDGVVLVDSCARIQWANDAVVSMFELPKSEVLKSQISDLIEGGFDLAKQAAMSGKSAVGRAKTELGREFYTEISAKYTEDFLVVSLRDVTQNYKTVTNILTEHESSRKVNKDKNAFLVKLSNELKSPIHSILGFSQAMVDGLGGEMSDKQEKYIKIINKNSNEMLYLLDKILELSKTESNLMEYDFQLFDCVNAIQTVMKSFDAQTSEKNLGMSFECEEGLKKAVFTDEASFKTILQNILEISIKSTDIGSVSVTAHHPSLEFVAQKELSIPEGSSEKSYLMVTVTDTGAGILEGDLAVLFEPYAQLDRPNKKNIVKSIALASVKNIVKQLKGDIWVESEPMQGTIYNIILPIEKYSEQKNEEPKSEE